MSTSSNSAALIESMDAQSVTRKRYGVGSYVGGVWVQPTPVVMAIRASVQPATGEDLVSLPEGRRERETFKIYTVTDLRSGDEPLQIKADVLTLYGSEFEVQQVQRHYGLGYNHFKALVTKVNPT
jgi:hypothetical protein